MDCSLIYAMAMAMAMAMRGKGGDYGKISKRITLYKDAYFKS